MTIHRNPKKERRNKDYENWYNGYNAGWYVGKHQPDEPKPTQGIDPTQLTPPPLTPIKSEDPFDPGHTHTFAGGASWGYATDVVMEVQGGQPRHNISGDRIETDPLGKDAKAPGSKLDAGKPAVWQGFMDYFPRAMLEVAALSTYGSTKYTWKGWETVPDGQNRYKNAAGRHNLKIATEGRWDLDARNDPKHPAKILHQTQVVWNELAALELLLRAMEKEVQL